MAFTTAEALPAPAEFTARNVTLYSVPLVKPVITNGDTVDAGDRETHVFLTASLDRRGGDHELRVLH